MDGQVEMDPVTALWWITVGKILVGLMLLGIVATSIYRFKGLVVSVMGLLLFSNLLTLVIIAGLT